MLVNTSPFANNNGCGFTTRSDNGEDINNKIYTEEEVKKIILSKQKETVLISAHATKIVSDSTTEMKKYKEKCEKLEKDNKAILEENEKHKLRASQMKIEVKNLKVQIEKLNINYEKAESEKKRLNEQIDKLKTNEMRNLKEITELNKTVTDSNDQIAKLELNELKNLSNLQTLLTSKTNLTNEIASLKEQIEDIKDKESNLLTTNKDLDEQIKELMETQTNNLLEIENLKDELKEKEIEEKKIKGKNSLLENDKRGLLKKQEYYLKNIRNQVNITKDQIKAQGKKISAAMMAYREEIDRGLIKQIEEISSENKQKNSKLLKQKELSNSAEQDRMKSLNIYEKQRDFLRRNSLIFLIVLVLYIFVT